MPVRRGSTAPEIAQMLRDVADQIERADELVDAEVIVLPDTERALGRMVDAPGRHTLSAVVVWGAEPA